MFVEEHDNMFFFTFLFLTPPDFTYLAFISHYVIVFTVTVF